MRDSFRASNSLIHNPLPTSSDFCRNMAHTLPILKAATQRAEVGRATGCCLTETFWTGENK
jgi:hypothetical protein